MGEMGDEMAPPEWKDYILVVDDTNFMRLLLGKILNAYGYNVKTVPSGYEALREAEKCAPRLIFLDLNLPGDHGLDVCAALRQLEHCKSVPIVVCSAQQTREMVQRSKLVGANDFLCKPVDRNNVGERLIKHLGPEAAPGYVPHTPPPPVRSRRVDPDAEVH
jgi:CheY-like chemotaxis protein